MNVHIIPSSTLNPETFDQVMHLLWKYTGTIQFIKGSPISIGKVDLEMYFENKEKYFEKKPPPDRSEQKYSLSEIEFPAIRKAVSWGDLFELCENYRQEHTIPEEDHVILLSDKLNAHNWFGCTDSSLKNYFIQANDWEYLFGEDINIRYPIVYEIAGWLIRTQMYDFFEEILDSYHEIPQGCLMDYCKRKTDIILKMRTADLCPKCLLHLEQKQVDPNYLRQLFSIIEGIRGNLTFFSRSSILKQKSRLEIRGYGMDLFLTDLGDLEVKLNPKEKAMYMLYLSHPEGISRSHLSDFKDELRSYYGRCSNLSSIESIEEAIEKMIDVTDNNMNEIMSRIRYKFRKLLGPYQSADYMINSTPEMIHTVNLDRALVTFNIDS